MFSKNTNGKLKNVSKKKYLYKTNNLKFKLKI